MSQQFAATKKAKGAKEKIITKKIERQKLISNKNMKVVFETLYNLLIFVQ